MAWISGIAGFFKSPRGAWQAWRCSRVGAVQPTRPRAVRSGEPVRRVSAAETTKCLFCGRTASVRSFEAAVQLNCSARGACEVTVEAMGLLRADGNLREAVLRQVRRHRASGAERPLVNLEFIRSLKGR